MRWGLKLTSPEFLLLVVLKRHVFEIAQAAVKILTGHHQILMSEKSLLLIIVMIPFPVDAVGINLPRVIADDSVFSGAAVQNCNCS